MELSPMKILLLFNKKKYFSYIVLVISVNNQEY